MRNGDIIDSCDYEGEQLNVINDDCREELSNGRGDDEDD